MDDKHLERVQSLFVAVLETPAAERDKWLRGACVGQEAVLSEIRNLLRYEHCENDPLENGISLTALVEAFKHATSPYSSGDRIGKFEVRKLLGSGGFGAVYLCWDPLLSREVAVKVPHWHGDQVDSDFKRQLAEARKVAALEHAGVVPVFEGGKDDDGRPFFAMKYVRGRTLDEWLCEENPTPVETAAMLARVADTLAFVHGHDMVHRDLKPSNILIDEHRHPYVADFGLALTDSEHSIRSEGIAGTPAYMAPEQLSRDAVGTDARTDIWSLGVVLFESLTGQRPFKGDNLSDLRRAILYDEPVSPHQLAPGIPIGLHRVCFRCLRKSTAERLPTARELADALWEQCPRRLRPSQQASLRTRVLTACAFVMIGLLIPGAIWCRGKLARRSAQHRAISAVQKFVTPGRFDALAEDPVFWHDVIVRYVQDASIESAFSLLNEIRADFGGEPWFHDMWNEVAADVEVDVKPTGSVVSCKPYASDGQWQLMGESPRFGFVPRVWHRFKVELPGREAYETMWFPFAHHARFWADFVDDFTKSDPDMVVVYGVEKQCGLYGLMDYSFPDVKHFLLDRFEVTNQDYSMFVQAGGYQDRTYWPDRFMRDGEVINWEEALESFVDTTDQYGPAGWVEGDYSNDEVAELPVTGISWYEAMAYARFKGKQLPTVAHWTRAASLKFSPSAMLPRSNFSQRALAEVGQYQGVAFCGAYDLAGNVKEWCFNENATTPGERFTLGGAWDEAVHTFLTVESTNEFARVMNVGFRCMKEIRPEHSSPMLRQAIERDPLAPRPAEPCTDDRFLGLLTNYRVDQAPLHASVIDIDTESSDEWRLETVEVDVTYADEKMPVLIFLPEHAEPPYQAIIGFPGGYGPISDSSAKVGRGGHDQHGFNMVTKGKRAFVFPIYKDMYERHSETGSVPTTSLAFRNRVIHWAKDFNRTVDYIITRDDIDSERLGYYGYSLGAGIGPLVLTVDEHLAGHRRIRAGLLHCGGLWPGGSNTEVDNFHFAPRCTTPILMLNGRFDTFYPFQQSQQPLFRLLGSPYSDKVFKVYDEGHWVSTLHLTNEGQKWFDTHLGAVE